VLGQASVTRSPLLNISARRRRRPVVTATGEYQTSRWSPIGRGTASVPVRLILHNDEARGRGRSLCNGCITDCRTKPNRVVATQKHLLDPGRLAAPDASPPPTCLGSAGNTPWPASARLKEGTNLTPGHGGLRRHGSEPLPPHLPSGTTTTSRRLRPDSAGASPSLSGARSPRLHAPAEDFRPDQAGDS